MNHSLAHLFNGSRDIGGLLGSRSVHYGDGVFRTVLRHDGQWIQWQRQMEKLRDDAAALDLDAPDAQSLLAESTQIAGERSRCVLKILLMRASAGRGYRSESRQADRLLMSFDAPHYPAAHWSQGVQVFRAPLQLASQPQLAGIKHLNRLEQVLASRHWPPGMEEGISCSAEGAPVCGTRSNLFWVRDGRLFTPDLSRCGVAGVMRQAIIDNALKMKIDLQIVRGDWRDFADADEAFISNSLIGIWPIRALDGRQFPRSPGLIGQRLSEALAHPRLRIEPA